MLENNTEAVPMSKEFNILSPTLLFDSCLLGIAGYRKDVSKQCQKIIILLQHVSIDVGSEAGIRTRV